MNKDGRDDLTEILVERPVALIDCNQMWLLKKKQHKSKLILYSTELTEV